MFRLAAAITLSLAALGTPLRQDGYSFRPPERFRMIRMELFHGTRAGAVAVGPVRERYLSAALTDGDGPDAASLIIAIVGESFSATPSSRDAFSTAVVHHFADELGIPLSLERVELVRGPAPRIEVTGTIKQQDQVRTVLIAAMGGEGRHAVVTFSAPSGRFDALRPQVRASLDTFQAETPAAGTWSRSVAGVVAVLLAFALFVSWSLWRRRRERAREGKE
ncbi:MAG: hypothetical protein IRZ16_13275 [Myxococcaceae bacterium]|nr:hypothetical protein [Myxococcaceae bacterium]